MIRIDCDENVHEADLDLIERFAEALIDQDPVSYTHLTLPTILRV